MRIYWNAMAPFTTACICTELVIVNIKQTITVKIMFSYTKCKIIHSLFDKSDFFAHFPCLC